MDAAAGMVLGALLLFGGFVALVVLTGLYAWRRDREDRNR